MRQSFAIFARRRHSRTIARQKSGRVATGFADFLAAEPFGATAAFGEAGGLTATLAEGPLDALGALDALALVSGPAFAFASADVTSETAGIAETAG